MSYPVLDILSDINESLNRNSRVIVQAPPGAGKSTILPLRLLDHPILSDKKILMLEPRRLAAKAIADRVASLMNEVAGQTVGYRVRLESKVSKQTRLEVVTEGILTRMIQSDNALADVGLVIFDEFHERSLNADLALALVLQVQEILRPDLKIMIMSATLDASGLSAVLGNATVHKSEGRNHPVDITYFDTEEKNITASTIRGIRKALREQQGDILVFLPGVGEISRVAELLEAEYPHVMITPLFGDLSFQQQQRAILPDRSGQRKIVLSTSIAETSLTIEGITTVVDCGYARVPRFDPRSGFTKLETVRITRDAADQRAGRAGRTGPGHCYRLWSSAVQNNLVARRKPEILDADLSALVLEIRQWGAGEHDLMWIDPPPPGAVNQASELLHNLEALSNNKITERGKQMLRLPAHPRIAHMLLCSAEEKDRLLTGIACDVAALIEERDPLGREAGADLSLRFEALRKWRSRNHQGSDTAMQRIEKVARSWREMFKLAEDNSVVDETRIGKVLMYAFPERIARQHMPGSNRYKLANGRAANLPEHDQLARAPWICVANLDAGGGEGKIFLAAAVAREDLQAVANRREVVFWENQLNQVVARVEYFFGALVISTQQVKEIDAAKRIEVLCDVIREKGLSMMGWNEVHQQWQVRVLSMRQWRPEEEWPDVTTGTLLHSIDTWLPPFLHDVRKATDLLKLDLLAILNSILGWELQSKLEKLAPEKLEVPSGSFIRLEYFPEGKAPVMEVRIQELFGLAETPTVNQGRNKVTIHLLSPGYKPVQVTQDLNSFWNNTYPEIRKELRIRYPKHSWPDDPWTAEAVRGVKRRS